MLYEYAVEPKAIGSNWQEFRYLFEKFGFDRGRLISQFPKSWLREVYEASAAMKPVERARLEESLRRAKQTKIIRKGRAFDPALGSWINNALAQHAVSPFHAIIAEVNPTGHGAVVVAEDADELNPLMQSAHTWQVPRVGSDIAAAMAPILLSARRVLFVDRFFNIENPRYRETLKACLDLLHAHGHTGIQCQIHFCDHDRRPPADLVEIQARRWIRGIIPDGMSIVLFTWRERNGGEDFHARYLLTDVGGINVEAGFSAEGVHQNVQVGLLASDFCQAKLNALERNSSVYDLVAPVLEISANGSVKRI